MHIVAWRLQPIYRWPVLRLESLHAVTDNAMEMVTCRQAIRHITPSMFIDVTRTIPGSDAGAGGATSMCQRKRSPSFLEWGTKREERVTKIGLNSKWKFI